MATTSPTIDPPRSGSPVSFAAVLLLGGVLVAVVPFSVVHLRNMWLRPHYQVFPIVLMGVAYLLYRRWPRSGVERTPASNTMVAAALVAAAALTSAALLFISPWLGSVAAIMALAAGIFWFAGESAARRETGLLGVWAMLWLIVPLPFRLDIELIQWLQRTIAGLNSGLLDALGFNHFLQGTVIEFPDKRLLVERACSGVQSLFALVSCAFFLAVWERRSFFHTFGLLGAACGWAFLANLVRVLTVSYAYGQAGIDLSTGLIHELLGFGVFAIAIGLLLSTDQLLLIVCSPLPMEVGLGPFCGWWNRWVASWGSHDPGVTSEAWFHEPAERGERRWWGISTATLRMIAWPLGLGFVVLGATELFIVLGHDRAAGIDPVKMEDRLVKSSLPEQIGDWELTSYETFERGETSEEGMFSQTWTYRGPRFSALVSFDYPFVDSHPLSNCYAHQGWNLFSRRVVLEEAAAAGSDESAGWAAVEARYAKPLSRYALLLFSLFDGEGLPVSPPRKATSYLRKLTAKLESTPLVELLRARGAGVSPWSRNVYQVQLFLVSERPFSIEERAAAVRQFQQLRETMRTQWVTQDGGG